MHALGFLYAYSYVCVYISYMKFLFIIYFMYYLFYKKYTNHNMIN